MSRELVYSRDVEKWLDADDVAQMEREQDRHDAIVYRADATRCPTHGCVFVAGCGVAGEPTHYFGPGGGCPACYWESKKPSAALKQFEVDRENEAVGGN
jgi:hypothetical protein